MIKKVKINIESSDWLDDLTSKILYDVQECREKKDKSKKAAQETMKVVFELWKRLNK